MVRASSWKEGEGRGNKLHGDSRARFYLLMPNANNWKRHPLSWPENPLQLDTSQKCLVTNCIQIKYRSASAWVSCFLHVLPQCPKKWAMGNVQQLVQRWNIVPWEDHYFGSKKSRRGGHTALSTSCLVVSRPWWCFCILLGNSTLYKSYMGPTGYSNVAFLSSNRYWLAPMHPDSRLLAW